MVEIAGAAGRALAPLVEFGLLDRDGGAQGLDCGLLAGLCGGIGGWGSFAMDEGSWLGFGCRAKVACGGCRPRFEIATADDANGYPRDETATTAFGVLWVLICRAVGAIFWTWALTPALSRRVWKKVYFDICSHFL